MGNEDSPAEPGEKTGVWQALGRFFDGVALKAKLIIGAIIGVVGFISVFLLRKKVNGKQILELELKRVREQVAIEMAQEEIDRNDEEIFSLEGRISEIKDEIKKLDEFEARKEVSDEQLDEFFDDRGF